MDIWVTGITRVLVLKRMSGIVEQPASMAVDCNPPGPTQIDSSYCTKAVGADNSYSILEMFSNIKCFTVRRKCKTLWISSGGNPFDHKSTAYAKVIGIYIKHFIS